MDRSKWEYKKLGEVAKFINGDRGVNYPSQSDFVEFGVPFVNAGHLKNNAIDFSSMNYIAREKFDKLGSGKIQKGDLLFCLRGSLGKKAIVDSIEEGAIASSLVILRPSAINTRFLSYYLDSSSVNCEIERSNNGSSQPNLSARSVSQFLIPIPDEIDQQRIVAELDCLNEMIALKQEQLKEFDKLAQSIFYDMFGDPSMNGKGWDVATLKSICTKITDGTHDTPKRITSGVKFITGKHIRPFYVDYDNSDYVTEDVHREIYSRCNPEFGDVLYTNIGAGVGNAALNTVEYEFSMKNVALLKPKQDLVCGLYITHYLNEPGIKKIIIDNHTNGGAQIFLSLKAIGDIPVSLPPLALQQQFAEKIQAIEAQKELVKKSIAETQHLLDSRMDYYFD